MTDMKGIPMEKRYEIIRTLHQRRIVNHHELCEVTAGRRLGYWSEDMCDCATTPSKKSGNWTGLGDK